MFYKYITFFLIFIWSVLPSIGWSKTYLLAEPIHKTTEMSLSVKVANFLGVHGRGMMDSYTYWLATHDLYGTAAIFGLEYLVWSPVNTGISRIETDALGHYLEKNVRNLPELKQAESVKLLTTGLGEQFGTFNGSSRYHSTALVFADFKEGIEPEEIGGRQWIPVEDLSEYKIGFQLETPGPVQSAMKIEIPLQELFEGKDINPEILKNWRSTIKQSSKQFPFYKKVISGGDKILQFLVPFSLYSGYYSSFDDKLKITSSLIVGDQEPIPIGEFTRGKGVNHIVGRGLLNKLKNWARFKSPGRTNWKTVERSALKSSDCRSWFIRFITANEKSK